MTAPIHTAAIFRVPNSVRTRVWVSVWSLTMFRMPAYDPFSIAIMGFGILVAVTIALAF